MRIVRFGQPACERYGALDAQGGVRDLATVIDQGAPEFSGQWLDALRRVDLRSLPLVPPGTRLGPCAGAVGKIVGVGLNYADHARESGMAAPLEPVLFMKPASSLSGPRDPIVIPRGANKVDWEVELGVVIGARAKYVSLQQAAGCIAGFCVVNDVSDRGFQLEGTGQWVKGKAADTFTPIGPCVVTADEVADPQTLDLWLTVNGVPRQRSNTGQMIFSAHFLVSYISRFMTLLPGDLISTGTPPGVGLGMRSPTYLRAGDVVRLGVAGLGEQEQHVSEERAG